ncbi:dephospho-CoA kinase [Psychromicrobium silvestre]|uniref:Dephospho-CoA kinase n=1 Tax=Psychromicrobium silvestre TaxID=1645614 RepID=A0A7Y9LRA4_9MICC|nr:dephospho-CoA kinase [Psychromicrobium silvestre]NYE94142.1 dephospho-CoA kinase [Psychromicrobium silvestre]
MLSIGLTGGIAAGKSLVARRLAELGAVLIDADQLAREVVEPGTVGLSRVLEAFGPEVRAADGSLDRAVLGQKIFAEDALREKLNAIIHPLVRQRAAALQAAAAAQAVVVQDIPLLAETGQGAAFHLVLVVDAADEIRLERLIRDRGMTESLARQRMAAQASRQQRLAVADVVIDNNGEVEDALAQVERLWKLRLEPFVLNLQFGRRADRPGPAILRPADPEWPEEARRLSARIMAAVSGDAAGEGAVGVDHIGSTAVPGLEAKDVIDLQLRVPSLELADQLEGKLAAAGFPRVPGVYPDVPKSFDPDPAHWQKRLHGNADPGRAVNLHLRVDGSAGANYALSFRDWLRAEPEMREAYAVEKRRVAALHATDQSTAGYAEAKEPWFTEVAEPALEAWKTRSGWTPPRV